MQQGSCRLAAALASWLTMASLVTFPGRAEATHHARPRRVGYLSIESRPPDPVRLYINGRRAGVTPVRRLRVRAGKRLMLEAIRPDGARQRRVLRVRRGEERQL